MSGAEEDPVLEGPRVDSTLHPGLRRHDDDARGCILKAPEQVTCMHRAIFELGQAEADQSVNLTHDLQSQLEMLLHSWRPTSSRRARLPRVPTHTVCTAQRLRPLRTCRL